MIDIQGIVSYMISYRVYRMCEQDSTEDAIRLWIKSIGRVPKDLMYLTRKTTKSGKKNILFQLMISRRTCFD